MTSAFRRSREGRIRLGDDETGQSDPSDDDDDDDDDCDAPFGGYSRRRDDETRAWKLPERLDEKAACI